MKIILLSLYQLWSRSWIYSITWVVVHVVIDSTLSGGWFNRVSGFELSLLVPVAKYIVAFEGRLFLVVTFLSTGIYIMKSSRGGFQYILDGSGFDRWCMNIYLF